MLKKLSLLLVFAVAVTSVPVGVYAGEDGTFAKTSDVSGSSSVCTSLTEISGTSALKQDTSRKDGESGADVDSEGGKDSKNDADSGNQAGDQETSGDSESVGGTETNGGGENADGMNQPGDSELNDDKDSQNGAGDSDISGNQENSEPKTGIRLNSKDHIVYMNGRSETEFCPNATITRAEIAKIVDSLLEGASDEYVVQTDTSFSDVKPSDWFAPSVENVVKFGIMSGNSDGCFSPNAEVTRAELVTVLSKFTDLEKSNRTFTDVPESHWAHDAIISAAEQGWVTGYTDGSFHPDGTVTRAEAATLINRFLGRTADASVIAAGEGLKFFSDVKKSYWAYSAIMETTMEHKSEVSGNGLERWTSFTHYQSPDVTVTLDRQNHIKYFDGSSDGRFYPDAAVTRGEVAQMIFTLITQGTEDDLIAPDVVLSDVAADSENYWAIHGLLRYGVMSAVGSEFRPDVNISRAEFVEILARFTIREDAAVPFTDVPEDYWAYSAIATGIAQGWIWGSNDGLFNPDGTISRAEAVTLINRYLGRHADMETISSGAGIRIFLDLPNTYWAYADIMEATISHEHTGSGETEKWTSFTREKSALSVGFNVVDGALYLVDSSGALVTNQYVDGHWYGADGKYTTGNETLDVLMRNATKACVTSGMTQHQMLKAAFNYMINNYTYLSREKLATGAKGWTESYAVPMFQKHKGNCYSFAAAYYYLAKNIGYNPREIAGLVGHNRRPHGWIEIDMDGRTYIYDTELTMAKRRDGYSYYLYEMTYGNAPFIYAKR